MLRIFPLLLTPCQTPINFKIHFLCLFLYLRTIRSNLLTILTPILTVFIFVTSKQHNAFVFIFTNCLKYFLKLVKFYCNHLQLILIKLTFSLILSILLILYTQIIQYRQILKMLMPLSRKEKITMQYANKIKVYLNCKNCQFMFCSDDNRDINLSLSKVDQYDEIRASQLKNIQMVNDGISWKLSCLGCQQKIGIIQDSKVLLNFDKVNKYTIKYMCQRNQKQNGEEQQNNKQRKIIQTKKLYKKLQAYISLSLNKIDEQLSKIDLSKAETMQKQLLNFMKFYQKYAKQSKIQKILKNEL